MLFELFEVAGRFTVHREHMPEATELNDADHYGNKDQVWLKSYDEAAGRVVLNTIEDHYGREEYHGQVVTMTLDIQSTQPRQRTRKSHQVDHATIAKMFHRPSIDAIKGLRDNYPEVAQLHEANPFFRFIFGRGLWSYIPKADVTRTDELISKAVTDPLEPALRGKSWSWMMYPIFPDQPPSIIPVSTDHEEWLEKVDMEWDYATDEQRELMQRCLTKMREDGHETPDF